MGSRVHRAPQTEGRKPVNGAIQPRACVTVSAGYDRWAATYDGSPNPLLAREERHLVPRLPDLRGKVVLDVACGTGRWLRRLRDLDARAAVGLDISKRMLEAGVQKPGLRGNIAQADFVNLPIAADVIDFVICAFALNHVEEIGRLFREFARVMRRGGTLIVTDLHPIAQASGWRTGFRDEQGSAHIETHSYSAEDVMREAEESGFGVRTLHELRIEREELPIFQTAKKLQSFADVIGIPAVLALEFARCP